MNMRTCCFDLLCFLNKDNKGYTKSQLKEHFQYLNLTSKEFDRIIKALQEVNVLRIDKTKHLFLNQRNEYIDGTYVITKNKRFVSGYDLNNVHRQVDIPEQYDNQSFYKDKVLAVCTSGKEGKILLTFEHYNTTLTGTYMNNGTYGFVILDNKNYNKDVFIPEEYKNNALAYDKVEVEIQPTIHGKNPEGRIVKVLAFDSQKEERLSLDSILELNHIQKKHSLRAMNQIKKLIANEKENLAYELRRRVDLTAETIFTIDGTDSKDLDDAISIKKLENGNYLLGVHIADVSQYVTEGSKMDEEALHRGTSVYLINKVIPMLPPILSNDLCSLNPNQLRLTLSCEMEINHAGKVVNSRVFESFIKSKAKLNYPQVTSYLEQTDQGAFQKQYPLIAADLLIMKELMDILYAKRIQRGSVEFDFEESKIVLGESDCVISVSKYERGISNHLIEEFMLVCNETIAERFFRLEIPFIYRVHEQPREERYEQLQSFVKKYGYELSADYENLSPKEFQTLLNKVKGTSEELPINLLALKTMQQARYYAVCNTHFGLAATYYTHFTSPIRRYPDLQIHRIIKEQLRGDLNAFRKHELEEIVTHVAKECSKKERIADRVEEEYQNLKKAEFLSHNTEEFHGIVTNMNEEYMEVTLDNTIVGTLPYKKSDYKFYEDEFVIKDNAGNVQFELGQSLTVMVKKVSLNPTVKIQFKVI